MFMLSQLSTDLRSAMRFSMSFWSSSGASGNPIGAHIFFSSSNRSWNGVSWVMGARCGRDARQPGDRV